MKVDKCPTPSCVGPTTALVVSFYFIGSTGVVTLGRAQFDPQDWYKSLHDAVVAESILNRIVSNAELVQLDGPNMRRHLAETSPGATG